MVIQKNNMFVVSTVICRIVDDNLFLLLMIWAAAAATAAATSLFRCVVLFIFANFKKNASSLSHYEKSRRFDVWRSLVGSTICARIVTVPTCVRTNVVLDSIIVFLTDFAQDARTVVVLQCKTNKATPT